ncbi:MAG: DUF4369 domain-containing protein [Paramuribaculum sp.]|nr:DUF4369 domain-containing protein [Paramuribaculum sp.]
MKHFCIVLISAAMTLASCSDSNHWKISGNVDDGQGQTLYLEANTSRGWTCLDSTVISTSGKFEFSQPAAGYPDIYRLRLNAKSLYFPIDSIENLSLTSNALNFDREFTIDGSESARKIMLIDKHINAMIENPDINQDSIVALKRQLTDLWLSDRNNLVAYYMLNKQIQGIPLFNPADRFDLKVFGAVATAMHETDPDNPRTTEIERIYLTNRALNHSSSDIVDMEQADFFDINLFDAKGKEQSLMSAAKDNKVVLLSFSSNTEEFSPALNAALNSLYERYHDKGLEIYQTSFDIDEFHWRESAKNLPWISVHGSPAAGAEILSRYNVGILPTHFIISNGELLERIVDLTTLENRIKKHL